MRIKTSRMGAKTKALSKRRDAHIITRKKFCRFCVDKEFKLIDYKDVKRLETFITDRGKILSSRLSGNCAKHQRRIAEAIKKARFISLVLYKR
jgi:small subunit ribosomal protein S18